MKRKETSRIPQGELQFKNVASSVTCFPRKRLSMDERHVEAVRKRLEKSGVFASPSREPKPRS